MKVSEAIKQLEAMPPGSDIFYYWDMGARSSVDLIYETKDGRVIISSNSEFCLTDEDNRPKEPI